MQIKQHSVRIKNSSGKRMVVNRIIIEVAVVVFDIITGLCLLWVHKRTGLANRMFVVTGLDVGRNALSTK